MPYDFKSDLAKYKGQDQTVLSGLTDAIGGVDKKVPVFGEDIQQYKSEDISPGGDALKSAVADLQSRSQKQEEPKQEEQKPEENQNNDEQNALNKEALEKKKAEDEARRQKAEADRAAKMAENEAQNKITIENKKQEMIAEREALNAEKTALDTQPDDPTKIDLVEQEEKRQQQIRIDKMLSEMPDPNDEEAMKASMEPDELLPTANVEIDYGNTDLATQELIAVPEGTIGGHCGVYAEEITRMPNGERWLVGDHIEQKKKSLDRYREDGFAFRNGEDEPQVGNSLIQEVRDKDGNPTEWGHVGVVNSVNDDGTITITESNWKNDKKVTHTRRMRKDDPSIYGYLRTK